MSPEERMASLINTSNSSEDIGQRGKEKKLSLSEELPDYNQWGELNEALYKQNNLIFLIDISFQCESMEKLPSSKSP